jgi:hypothetical protein
MLTLSLDLAFRIHELTKEKLAAEEKVEASLQKVIEKIYFATENIKNILVAEKTILVFRDYGKGIKPEFIKPFFLTK